jgi:hypothetical protein
MAEAITENLVIIKLPFAVQRGPAAQVPDSSAADHAFQASRVSKRRTSEAPA